MAKLYRKMKFLKLIGGMPNNLYLFVTPMGQTYEQINQKVKEELHDIQTKRDDEYQPSFDDKLASNEMADPHKRRTLTGSRLALKIEEDERDEDQVLWEIRLERYSRYRRIFYKFNSQNPDFKLEQIPFKYMTREQKRDRILYLWQRLKLVCVWPGLLPRIQKLAFMYEKERFCIDSDESVYIDSDHEREELLNHTELNREELEWYLIDPASTFSVV